MDIKNTEDKINQVDSLLTTITKVLKKHWLILLLSLMGYGMYAIMTSDDEIVENNNTEQEIDPIYNITDSIPNDTLLE